MSEVARHPIIAFSPEEYPSYQRLTADLLLPYTHAPQILPEYDNLESIIMAVAAGSGVAILYEDTSGIFRQRLVLRPLDPSPEPPPVVIAYRQEGLLTTVSGFVEAARTAKLRRASCKPQVLSRLRSMSLITRPTLGKRRLSHA
jgi:DNA-binding transcriptional LysR family regulator